MSAPCPAARQRVNNAKASSFTRPISFSASAQARAGRSLSLTPSTAIYGFVIGRNSLSRRNTVKKLIWILPLLAGGLVWSQDSGDRITVPFSDPSRPHTLKVGLINGGITVKGYDGKDAIIETRSGQSGEHERRHVPRGA